MKYRFLLFLSLYLIGAKTSAQLTDYYSLWEERTFNSSMATQATDFQVKSTNNVLSISDNVEALVYNNQFGVNTTFRSGNDILERTSLYEPFGAFRYPAGSGSNKFFWDCNFPVDTAIEVNEICGTKTNHFKPSDFIEFTKDVNGNGTIVINYMYARYGLTTEGTREARVAQAAEYAAAFVEFMNVENDGNIKFWEIGNECYGKWETGFDVNGSIVTGTEYGEDFKVFYEAMKNVDPSINIGAVLWHKENEWNDEVVFETAELADFFIVHHYFKVKNQLEINDAISEVGKDIHDIKMLVENNSDREYDEIPVAFTEFNIQGPVNSTILNAQYVTEALMQMIKSGVFMTNIWVNEWKLSENETKGLLAVSDPDQQDYSPRPSYMPFYFLHDFFGDKMVAAEWDGTSSIKTFTSKFSSGEYGIVLINYSDKLEDVSFKKSNVDFTDADLYYNSVYSLNNDELNRKFYVNGVTSQTPQGGPVDLKNIATIMGSYNSKEIISLEPYSVSFVVIDSKIPNNTQNNDQGSDFKIFPNPATNILQVFSGKSNIENYKIFDTNGCLVANKNSLTSTKNIKIPVGDYAPGNYIIQLDTGKEIAIKKWVKSF